MFESETVTIDIFGGCPRCGGITGHREVEFEHWGYCAEHKLRWAQVGKWTRVRTRSVVASLSTARPEQQTTRCD
jgi:hypothetical protein